MIEDEQQMRLRAKAENAMEAARQQLEEYGGAVEKAGHASGYARGFTEGFQQCVADWKKMLEGMHG